MKFSPLYIRAAIALAMVVSFNARAEDTAKDAQQKDQTTNTEVQEAPARGGGGGGARGGGGAEHGPSGGGEARGGGAGEHGPSGGDHGGGGAVHVGGGEPHGGGGEVRPQPTPRPVGPVGGDHGGDRPEPGRPEPVVGGGHGGDHPEPGHPVVGGGHGGDRPDPGHPIFGGGHAPHGFPTQHIHWQDPEGRHFWRWNFEYAGRPCYIYYVDTGVYSDNGNHATVADQNAADEVASEAQDYINEIEAVRASGAPVTQLSMAEMTQKYPSFLYTAQQDGVDTSSVDAMEDLAKAIIAYDAGLAD